MNKRVTSPLLTTAEDRDDFLQLVFTALMSLLRQGKPDCAYFQRVLAALLP